MHEFLMTIKIMSAVVLGAISYLLGGWDVLLRALVVLSVLDIISGFTVALVSNNVSSRIAWQGFARKIGTYVVVALAVQLDAVFGSDMLRELSVGFFIGVEGISIIENWGSCGMPLPQKLKSVLQQLKSEQTINK